MLSQWRTHFICHQWQMVGWSWVGWSYQLMCAEASHILSDRSQILSKCWWNWPKVITIWSLLWPSFLPTGGCALSQQQEIYKPKGAMCNQNKADKNWIALNSVGYQLQKTIQKISSKLSSLGYNYKGVCCDA